MNSFHECIVIFCNFILSSPLFIRLQNVLIFLFCIEIFYPRNRMELRYKIFYFSTMMILFLLLYSFDQNRMSFYFAILRKKKFDYSTHKHIYIYTHVYKGIETCVPYTEIELQSNYWPVIPFGWGISPYPDRTSGWIEKRSDRPTNGNFLQFPQISLDCPSTSSIRIIDRKYRESMNLFVFKIQNE